MPYIYQQCSGDMCPTVHGGTFYRWDGYDSVELIEIQPCAEYIGRSEASELPHPFWVKAALVDWHDFCRLMGDADFLSYSGIGREDPIQASPAAIASVCAADSGYGLLDWEQLGNLSGREIASRFYLRGMDRKTLRPDLLDADREHRDLCRE